MTIFLSKSIEMEKNNINKALIFGLTLLLTITIVFILNNSFADTDAYGQQSYSVQKQTLSSIPHNAKGHQSHQIVNFQNPTDDVIYKGTVVFNSTKPVDIVSYKELAADQNSNSTVKIWEVGNKKFVPETLLSNSTGGTVNFEGNGVLAHNTQSSPYKVTFVINSTSTNSNNNSLVLGPLLNIFK